MRYIKYQQLPDTNHTIKPKDLSKAKAQRRFEIQSDAYHIFNAQTYEEATIRLTDFEQKWNLIEPEAVRVFQRDINISLTFYQFDTNLYSHIRTTNHLERLFREFRTKTDEIGTFPNETTPIKKKSLLQTLSTLEALDEDFADLDAGLLLLDDIKF